MYNIGRGEDMYSIKKVSEMVGISPVTIRAWENRYQVVSPIRSEGGHRLYSQKDIEVLRWLHEQTQNNKMKISDAARLLDETNSHTFFVEKFSNNRYDDLLENLYTSLTNLDNAEAHRLIDYAFSLFDHEEVIHNLMVPTLQRLGDEWEKNKITVAQEHFSSQLIMQRCVQLFRIFPVDPMLPKGMAFCPQGEEHQIGLLFFCLFLRKKGMDVIYLGANTPFEGLNLMIKQKEIEVITVSITNPKLKDALYKWIEDTHKESPHLKFVIGGDGIRDDSTPTQHITLLGNKNWDDWFTKEISRKT